jgi:hypothetical protein
LAEDVLHNTEGVPLLNKFITHPVMLSLFDQLDESAPNPAPDLVPEPEPVASMKMQWVSGAQVTVAQRDWSKFKPAPKSFNVQPKEGLIAHVLGIEPEPEVEAPILSGGASYFQQTLMQGGYTTGQTNPAVQGHQTSKEESDDEYQL